MKVKFRVLKLEDSRSDGSEIEVGNVYTGETSRKDLDRVFYTDRTGDEWIFYVGDTCEIAEEK